MTVREILKKSKMDLKGKRKHLLKPTIIYYLIFAILYSIFVLCVSLRLQEFKVVDLESVISLGIAGIIFSVIYAILFGIANILLNYGMAACITTLKREEKISFGTIFKFVKEKGVKAFVVSLKISLKILGRCILFILPTLAVFALLSVIFNYISSTFITIVALVLAAGIFIYCLVSFIEKLIQLSISAVLVNYLIYDFPEKENKAIIEKAMEIAKQKGQTFFTTILLTTLMILPLSIIRSILSTNFDMLIWKPDVTTTFFGTVLSVESTAPTWWTIFVMAFSGFVTIYTFLKILTSTSAFYESLSPKNLFDENFKLEKEEKKYSFINLGLIIAYVAVILLVSIGYSTIYKNIFTMRYQEQEKNTSTTSVDNIKIENIGVTKRGDLAIKLTNEDKDTAYISTVYAIFGSGERISAEEYSLYIEPNKEMYVHISDFDLRYHSITDEEIKNCKFEVNLSANSYFFSPSEIMKDKYNVTKLEDGLLIKLNGMYSNIKADAVFYKDNKIISIVESESGIIKGNSETYINIEYPIDSHYQELEFDKYDLYFYNVKKSTDKSSSAVKGLKTTLLGITTDNDAVIEVKNNSENSIYVSNVNLILKDKKNNVVDFARTTLDSFVVVPNDSVYIAVSLNNNTQDTALSSLKSEIVCEEGYSLLYSYAKEKLNMTYVSKDKIEVTIENNLSDTISTTEIHAVFFKNGKVVAYTSETDYSDIAPGEKVTIKVSQPSSLKYSSTGYDEVKVSIARARLDK